MVAVKPAPLRQAPKANKLAVFLGVAAALVITGARVAAQLCWGTAHTDRDPRHGVQPLCRC